jgi:hypothetical protein
MTIWPDMVGRHGGVEAAAQQRDGEQRGRHGRAENRGKQRVRLLQFLDARVAGTMEGGGREDEDGGVDGEREHQRDGRVEGGEAQRLAFFGQGFPVGAGLHDAGVQVEVVRHHGRAQDAERQVEHLRVGDDLGGGREALDDRGPVGIGESDLDPEADCDHAKEGDDQGFHIPEAERLEIEDQEDVEGRNDHAHLGWDPEDQVETDGGADHLGDVGCDDGHLGQEPEDEGNGLGVGVAASLREIAA